MTGPKECGAGYRCNSCCFEQCAGALLRICPLNTAGIGEDVVGTRRDRGSESSITQRAADLIALCFIFHLEIGVKVGVGELTQARGSSELKRRGAADVGQIMEVANGREPARIRGQIANAPSGDAEGL